MRNISFHVGDGICSGCGVCAALCPEKAIAMKDTEQGYYKSEVNDELCVNCGLCVNICTFSVKNIFTRQIEKDQYNRVDSICYSQECGYYLDSYVGFSEKYRETSASGGLTTWFLESVLQNKVVEAAICVGQNKDHDKLFKYRMITDPGELRQCSGSVYYPAEISDVLREIRDSNKKVAIVGLPCTISAIRLACEYDTKLKNNVKICVGLVCGYLGSKCMTRLIALSHSYSPEQIQSVRFRKKTGTGRNENAQITYKDGQERIVDWNDTESIFGLTFPYKVFTQLACDCCDDIFARNADIVFMDTCGLSGYAELTFTMGMMNSILVRSELAKSAIDSHNGQLRLYDFPTSEVVKTQQGRILHKYTQLTDRILQYKQQGMIDERIVSPFSHNTITPDEARKEQIINRMRSEISNYFKLDTKTDYDFERLIAKLKKLQRDMK
jgi:coenzyme F420-reducing hydrogenase beta subunit